MIQIPDRLNKQNWFQSNNSDIAPNIYISKNIDITENVGKVRVGKRLLRHTTTQDNADITSYPIGFKTFNNKKWTVAGTGGTGYVFSTTSNYPSQGSFSTVTGSGAPTDCDSIYSDIEVAMSKLWVTTKSGNVYYSTSGTSWSSVSLSSSNSPFMMTYYGGRLYCTRSSSAICSWSSSTASDLVTTGQYTLQLGDSSTNNITFIRSSSNRIWIGTLNRLGGKGYIYEWDGASTQVTKSYRLEAQGALSCVIKDDIPYVMDSNGSLIVWNGGTFKKVASLYRKKNKLLYNSTSSDNDRFIHPNGMSIINGNINLLIDGRNYDNTSTIEETIPSGVWEYTENSGLVHKHSFGLSAKTADILDFGQNRIYGVGGLSEVNIPNNASSRNGTFLAGATVYTNASSVDSGIWFDDSNDTEKKAGYFVTSKQYTSNPMEIWQVLFYRFRRLLTSTDKIVIKYRIEEVEPTEIQVTWSTIGASTTTFTTTDANIANYAVGDEVEGVQGTGSGTCSHIVSISVPVAGTYTVVVDEVLSNVSGTAKVKLNKWIKIGSNTYGDKSINYNDLPLPQSATSTWIQFKVYMIFTGRMELDDLILQTKASQSAK